MSPEWGVSDLSLSTFERLRAKLRARFSWDPAPTVLRLISTDLTRGGCASFRFCDSRRMVTIWAHFLRQLTDIAHSGPGLPTCRVSRTRLELDQLGHVLGTRRRAARPSGATDRARGRGSSAGPRRCRPRTRRLRRDPRTPDRKDHGDRSGTDQGTLPGGGDSSATSATPSS